HVYQRDCVLCENPTADKYQGIIYLNPYSHLNSVLVRMSAQLTFTFHSGSLAMLESVGPLGYVIRKLNQVRESRDQSRLEVVEIIEALILTVVALVIACI